MPWYWLLILQGLVTFFAVLAGLLLFHAWVLRPYMDRKTREIQQSAEEIAPRIREGVEEVLQASAESGEEGNTLRGTTRQFVQLGSDIMEGGLSTFLGGIEPKRRHRQE